MKNLCVVRVAVNNNFNCTDSEWEQLDQFAAKNPNKHFFVNSNVNTPRLQTIKDHPYKAVVTANPDITIRAGALAKIKTLAGHIAFARVKWLPEVEAIRNAITELLSWGIPVVVTMQRWNSKKSLLSWTSLEHYEFSCSRYRLAGKALKDLNRFVDNHAKTGLPIHICDRAGLGCQGCGLCSTLTTGMNLHIRSLNLSTSGVCPYNCPDCYAKTMSNFAEKLGHAPVLFDKIQANDKQRGATAHIKESRKKAERGLLPSWIPCGGTHWRLPNHARIARERRVTCPGT
jgi:hypothetical protein